MRFKLKEENAIRGDQLVDEILQAVGVDIGECYTFIPPDILEIVGFEEHEEAIGAAVAAHVPDPLYFPEDQERMEVEAARLRLWEDLTNPEARTVEEKVGDLVRTLTQG